MANINKLSWSFVDNQTTIYAEHMNGIVDAINSIIDALDENSGNGSQSQEPTPTPETVATPSISISGTTATISCSTSNATIRYAINGTPTESSGTIIANGGTISLSSYSQSTIIRAIAYKSGMTTSQVAQETYSPSASSVQPVVPTIVLNTTAKTVALSATSGLTIKYSTNGGAPTTTYSSPINVASGATIKAITTNGAQSSYVPKITIKYNENGGTIEFVTSEAGTIRYTIDGNNPTEGSTAYSSAITPASGTTYKVAVYNGSSLVSEIASVVIPS